MTDHQALRAELRQWIEQHLDHLTPGGASDCQIPIVTDFILAVAVDDACDGPGQGMTYIGHVSSAHAAYRTFGLLRAVEVAYRQPGGDDDG